MKKEILKATFAHTVAVQGKKVTQLIRFESGRQFVQQYDFDTSFDARQYGLALCKKIG